MTVMRSHSTDSGAIPMLRWMVGKACSASQRIFCTHLSVKIANSDYWLASRQTRERHRLPGISDELEVSFHD